MEKEIKSGREVIREFFDEIKNIDGVDEATIKTLVSLYENEKLKETQILNSLEELMQSEIKEIEVDDE